MRYRLILMFIPHDEGERITMALKSAGATGGTVTMGHTYPDNHILRFLGLGETSSDIVFCVAEEEKKDALIHAITKETENEKKGYGILFTIDVTKTYKSGGDIQYSDGKEGRLMNPDNANGRNTYELITVILNKGFADDAMAAARSAGAGGGTVIHGRGTARPEDASFFGITLVPEKELLMMIVEKEKTAAVLEAMKKLPCLFQPGSGIAFCMEAENFINLGKHQPS